MIKNCTEMFLGDGSVKVFSTIDSDGNPALLFTDSDVKTGEVGTKINTADIYSPLVIHFKTIESAKAIKEMINNIIGRFGAADNDVKKKNIIKCYTKNLHCSMSLVNTQKVYKEWEYFLNHNKFSEDVVVNASGDVISGECVYVVARIKNIKTLDVVANDGIDVKLYFPDKFGVYTNKDKIIVCHDNNIDINIDEITVDDEDLISLNINGKKFASMFKNRIDGIELIAEVLSSVFSRSPIVPHFVIKSNNTSSKYLGKVLVESGYEVEFC